MFKDNIKELRHQRNITQEQLASELGVERSTVGKWEGKGAIIPTIDVLKSIAGYFNVSIDYLLGRDAPAVPPESTGGVWVPVLGRLAAGIPVEKIEDVVDWEEIAQVTA